MVDKERKTAVVIDVSIPVGSNIKKKEHKKTEQYQDLKKQQEQIVVIEALRAATPADSRYNC